MTDHSVAYDCVASAGDPPIEADRLHDLVDNLPHGMFTIARTKDDRVVGYGVVFTVTDVLDAVDAAVEGERILTKAIEGAGLPFWIRTRVSAVTHDELTDELDRSNFPELVGIAELAKMIDATRQRAHSLARSNRFPSPVAELQSGPVFLRSSVEAFLETWDRKPGRPPRVVEIGQAVERDEARPITPRRGKA